MHDDILNEFNEWLSPRVEALTKEDYRDVLQMLREELDVMVVAVEDELEATVAERG
jgi:hypothetical protein